MRNVFLKPNSLHRLNPWNHIIHVVSQWTKMDKNKQISNSSDTRQQTAGIISATGVAAGSSGQLD